MLRWFLSGRLTPLRALLQDLVSVTLGVRISWHLRLDLGFSFCFPCRTALQCFHDLCLAALLDDQGLALPRPTCTSTPCIALSSPISSVLEPHQACRLGKGTLGSCCFVPGSSSSPNQYPAIHSCRPRLSPLVDHTGSRVSGASMPRRKGQRARVRPDGTRRRTRGEPEARAKRAAARAKAAAEDETQSEGEAAADNVSETELALLRPHWRCRQKQRSPLRPRSSVRMMATGWRWLKRSPLKSMSRLTAPPGSRLMNRRLVTTPAGAEHKTPTTDWQSS